MPDQSDGGIRERRAHPELAAEQRYLDRAYGRLDEMRKAASRVAEGYSEVQRGGTHQARLERDAAAANTRRRLAALNIGNAPLSFGRIDLEPRSDGENPGDDRFYIGRISVTEADQTPLIVDWRAPVAEPFYRATGVEPMGVVRRRHFQTHGRELIGIDDEVFDAAAADEAGFTIVGEAALLAALERHRTGRMGDIVATIQAEQDEAVRAPLSGILVVAGGPGTGKTAVALHRAAYLLYTHRQRLASRGVLLVGPSPIFLRYIDEVLPSLGEDDVQLTTVAGLKPQLRARASEPPTVAALKGDARMARVIARALRDRERPLRDDLVVVLDGHVLRLRRADSARIVERVRRRRGTHNERRPAVTRMVLDQLRDQYRRSLVAAYERDVRRIDPDAELPLAPEDDESCSTCPWRPRSPGVSARPMTGTPRCRRVSAAHPRCGPRSSACGRCSRAPSSCTTCSAFPALIRSAADGILSRDEDAAARPAPFVQRARRRMDRGRRGAGRRGGRAARSAGGGATTAPAPPAGRIGPRPRGRRPRRRRARRWGATRPRPRSSSATAAARRRPRTGSGSHARSGTCSWTRRRISPPMQWRMVGRRCPSGSMTLVGDFGQSSRPGAVHDWDDGSGASCRATSPHGSSRSRSTTARRRRS